MVNSNSSPVNLSDLRVDTTQSQVPESSTDQANNSVLVAAESGVRLRGVGDHSKWSYTCFACVNFDMSCFCSY
jgi:hypothetical protein